MDRSVTVRFYRVERPSRNTPRLLDVLQHIVALALPDRERTIRTDFDVRLEHMQPDGPNVVAGEFTRIQTTNFPSEVDGRGTHPLSVDNPLGHGIAFRFDHARSVLAIQYDVRVISPGRVFDYLKIMWPEASYRLRPLVRNDMWRRFNRGPVRKVEIAIASPSNLADIEGPDQAAFDAVRTLGGAYEAPILRVEMSMGRRNGALSDNVKTLARSLWEAASIGNVDIRAMNAVTEVVEGPNDEINLLDELLSAQEVLPLPDRDPERSYAIRRQFLQHAMNENV